MYLSPAYSMDGPAQDRALRTGYKNGRTTTPANIFCWYLQ